MTMETTIELHAKHGIPKVRDPTSWPLAALYMVQGGAPPSDVNVGEHNPNNYRYHHLINPSYSTYKPT